MWLICCHNEKLHYHDGIDTILKNYFWKSIKITHSVLDQKHENESCLWFWILKIKTFVLKQFMECMEELFYTRVSLIFHKFIFAQQRK